MNRGRALVAALAVCSCGPSNGPPDVSARPQPAAVGTPLGPPAAAEVGAPGGQLTSGDGRLVLEIPPGVVSARTTFQVQQVSNTAPAGVGAAYRLEPEGLTFSTPVRLTFTVDEAVPLSEVSVAWQEGQGYWLRLPANELVRDEVKRTISVSTHHFSGWSLVTGPTARDLHGTFTLDSSLDLPFAGATGVADFTFAGEDPDVAWYLLSGTITLPTPLAIGADSCVPEDPSLALRTNIAELRTAPDAFLWGMSGHWKLACTGPSGSTAELLLTAFDTQGIGALGCDRGYVGNVVLGPDRVRGTYTIDCGVRGLATASWSFDSNACGTACASTLPCHTAVIDCGSGTGVCSDVGLVPDGAPGACPPPQTCLGGLCVP